MLTIFEHMIQPLTKFSSLWKKTMMAIIMEKKFPMAFVSCHVFPDVLLISEPREESVSLLFIT